MLSAIYALYTYTCKNDFVYRCVAALCLLSLYSFDNNPLGLRGQAVDTVEAGGLLLGSSHVGVPVEGTSVWESPVVSSRLLCGYFEE